MTTTTTAPSLPVNPGTAAATAVDRAERPPITPRPGPREFDGVPKHWFAGLPVPTQISNGVNLLFPAGERFFVRSVYHYLDRIDDPKLKEAIKGFGGQEGRHARSHEDFFAAMRGHGYEIDRFLKVYEWLSYTLLERLAPPPLRLAATAAAEHYTAIMAAGAAADVPLELAHPAMRQLLYWHAAEELEHKSVAFDVLQQVNSSYALRVAGLAMSTAMLVSMWWTATLYLLWQDGITPWKAARSLRAMREVRPSEPIFRRVFLRGIRAYLRRDFHPDQDDNYHLAKTLLAKAEAARVEAAAATTAVSA
ncbi:MAG: metal-dependent hydrolase [Myxococcales bacterium]|nr:metal-dependent hydrolase [Myxococcales bacterium]MBK7191273.1 metal-dependent hydrolase [Myxococcales bacterium]MBP6848432.1 metal-dependent hydrolase [Kofleriaceae bacterium]